MAMPSALPNPAPKVTRLGVAMRNPASQIIVSACAAPSFAFIALNRWAMGHAAWAVAWSILCLLHCWGLYDALVARAKLQTNGGHHG